MPFPPFASSALRAAPGHGRCDSSLWETERGSRCSPPAVISSTHTTHRPRLGWCWTSGTSTAILRVCYENLTTISTSGFVVSRPCSAGSLENAATWPMPPTRTSITARPSLVTTPKLSASSLPPRTATSLPLSSLTTTPPAASP